MFKLSVITFILSIFSISVMADDDVAELGIYPTPAMCDLINAGIEVPGVIDISVCKK
ncbi:hypothetical protein HCO69_19410 [Pantoea sp. LS15]|uniref:hypothetical protein n=1 Tax=Enterobacterales TaxID=91347 RepID=UPI00143CB6C6|nr:MULTISPECIES: hypothetical protein [Enterobacterales]NJQ21781.1 hypothetical protein [Pantoea sp. LS15]NKF48377.1 hypothetical protein [Pantoea sp. LS15]